MRTCGCALLTALVCIGCGQAADPEEGRGTAQTEPKSPPGEIHWGYVGEVGPEHWADLRPDYSLCRDGVEQSPIDLTGAEPVQEASTEHLIGDAAATLRQRARVMDLIDNGHTVQVTTDVTMPLELDGVHYEFAQFHFHAPSEHTIGGVHSPLEVHLVHRSADGELAVIGVPVEEGEHDESCFSSFCDFPAELPACRTGSKGLVRVRPSQCLPRRRPVSHAINSFTIVDSHVLLSALHRARFFG